MLDSTHEDYGESRSGSRSGCRTVAGRAEHRAKRGSERAGESWAPGQARDQAVPATRARNWTPCRRLKGRLAARTARRRGQPVIVDANILLYAVDESSQFHARARTWLEGALNGSGRVGLPWPALTAFLRISTHPRAARYPLTSHEAWDVISDWLEASPAWIPIPGPRPAEGFRRLTLDGSLQGNPISDAHLAPLALEHGLGGRSPAAQSRSKYQATGLTPVPPMYAWPSAPGPVK